MLTLSRHAVDASGISYTGHSGPGAWVTNMLGVGLLCFYTIPVEPLPFPQPAVANDDGAADILGTSAVLRACWANHDDPVGFSQCENVKVIPEPAGIILVMMGVVGVGYYRRTR